MTRGKKWTPHLQKLFLLLIGLTLFFSAAASAWAEPRILSVFPAQLSQLDQVSQVSASVYGVTGDVQLSIDGINVAATLSGDVVTYNQNFSAGLHKAYLSVGNGSGQTAERVWVFYVRKTASDYLLPDKSTCEQCHSDTFYNFPGHQLDLSISGGHPYNCGACHYYGSKAPSTPLLVRADGTMQITGCNSCHAYHSAGGGSMYLQPKHDNTNWLGTWSSTNTTIKAPREDMDCQYCHQPETKVRLGHDLVADHEVDDPQCTGCHSNILTVAHNKTGRTCNTCHQSLDPVVQDVARAPLVAKAGKHTTVTGFYKTSVTQYYNDLNLSTVSLTVYGAGTTGSSPAWSPGDGLVIKRLTVDGWTVNDKPYVLAYVAQEDKWYTLSVADEGRILSGRYPSTFMGRELYLPAGTTRIKTKLVTGAGDGNYVGYLQVKEAYYNKPAKCVDCHSQTNHEAVHLNTALETSCNQCHQNILSKEHDRVNKAGVQLDCATCHQSSNPTVKQAITDKNKACDACHPQAGDHEAVHQSGVDAGFVRNSEMANNLSNTGCVTCHTNYPTNHAQNNCTTCHLGGVNTTAMWNCRYCHLTTYKDTYPLSLGGYTNWTGTVSGFKSWLDPLHNAPLGSKNRWMAGHFTGGSAANLPPNSWAVDANFAYHEGNPGYEHQSAVDSGCLTCHKNTLTAEHEGKYKDKSNPVEDFEDCNFTFNFTGDWGGYWTRVSEAAYAGGYSYKSGVIGGSSRYLPSPTASTQTTVNITSEGSVAFGYKVSSSGVCLKFLVDGTQVFYGNSTAWTRVTLPLTAGAHTLQWVSTGNSAYIDELVVSGGSTRYNIDCNTCHLSLNTAVKSAISNHNTSCTACHTMDKSHLTEGKTVLDNQCTTCHQSNLTKEHNRVNQAGEQLNCATCHESTEQTVVQSIAAGNTNCSSCHPQAGHLATHTSGLDAKCTICHAGSLVNEHMDNTKTNANKNYNCHTCHANADNQVKTAITKDNRKCTACHTSGHNMLFSEDIPEDIPQYGGFNWTTGLAGTLFVGDTTTALGYENAQVRISSRRNDVTVANVWNFYNTGLTGQGWTLKTGAPGTNADFFNAEFEKSGRAVIIKCYRTQNSNNQGLPMPAGYRIEIWYK